MTSGRGTSPSPHRLRKHDSRNTPACRGSGGGTPPRDAPNHSSGFLKKSLPDIVELSQGLMFSYRGFGGSLRIW